MMELSLIILYAHDVERSLAFYRDQLGLEVREQHGLDWVEVATGGTTVALHKFDGNALGEQQRTELFFAVDDVDQAYTTLRSNGVAFVEAPADQNFGFRTAACLDPDGNRVTLATEIAA